MTRFLASGLLIGLCALVPTMAAAQDQQPVPGERRSQESPSFAATLPVLDVWMTTPAGALWQAPIRRTPGARGPVLPSLYVSLIALEAYDGYSTSRGLRGGAIEANSLMGGLAVHPSALWAVKGGAALASIYVAERLWRNHHRGRAIAVMAAMNGMMAAVAVSNTSVIHAQR